MSNRLAESTSPYLLQHKDNPVEWWEWSEEAFDEARRRDVPVLLSVGYAACHWCHVMAHESFDDPKTAELMNDRFVNIKVDREERPDVDSIYMEAVQAMTGRGGWPMTVWMTPEGEPFFAGTYFPKDPHHGMASFTQVIEAISTAWTTQRDQVESQADQLVAAVSGSIPSGEIPQSQDLEKAIGKILSEFDATFGGFGSAPKFPQQPILEFLLRGRSISGDIDHVLETTLLRMADGGIHDHLGGGFARYSVDRQWLVPHFEKMLYDNAQMARIYLWAGLELGIEHFTNVARTTLDYLLNELRHPDGAFYSSEDADSEGEEGTFYVWTVSQFREVLDDQADIAADFFGVTESGNFEGKNVLFRDPDQPVPSNLDEIKAKLFRARSERVRPGLDDKVVASWNGLAIRAFAEAGAALQHQGYIDTAVEAARFIEAEMFTNESLARSWRDGRVSGPGFIDDYAAMAVGFFSLYGATGDLHWYQSAVRLTGQLNRFARPEGGFFSTADGSEELIKRPVDLTDNPSPSGNALAAEALLILSLYTGDLEARDKARQTLGAVGALAAQYPSMVGHHLAVAFSLATGTKELAIVGDSPQALIDVFWQRYRPNVVLAHARTSTDVVPLLTDRTPGAEGETVAYVCEDFVCGLPTNSPEELERLLEDASDTSSRV